MIYTCRVCKGEYATPFHNPKRDPFYDPSDGRCLPCYQEFCRELYGEYFMQPVFILVNTGYAADGRTFHLAPTERQPGEDDLPF